MNLTPMTPTSGKHFAINAPKAIVLRKHVEHVRYIKDPSSPTGERKDVRYFDFVLRAADGEQIDYILKAMETGHTDIDFGFNIDDIVALGRPEKRIRIPFTTYIGSNFTCEQSTRPTDYYPCFAYKGKAKNEIYQHMINRMHSSAESSFNCALTVLGTPERIIIYKRWEGVKYVFSNKIRKR